MMRFLLLFYLTLMTSTLWGQETMPSIYDFNVTTLEGESITLSDYRSKVLLIVNTASKCGFTPQYEGLETLYQKYKDQGLVILGFPCNQFGSQEPGTSKEIATFCQVNYGVTFPMFEKIEVNGKNTHPLYKFLKSEQSGILWTQKIKWNFTKFLVNKEGKVIERFSPTTRPAELEEKIKSLYQLRQEHQPDWNDNWIPYFDTKNVSDGTLVKERYDKLMACFKMD